MFLELTIQKNPALIEYVESAHQKGILAPDSYCIDVDTFLDNAKKILDKANAQGTKLFFMLKQVGRNPYLAKKLVELGYAGCVAVDYKEALLMIKHQIPLGNVGHLVQVPKKYLKEIIEYKPEVITVFSIQKCKEIDEISRECGIVTSIQLKVYDDKDHLYPGQEGGFHLSELSEALDQISSLSHVKVVGITAFPTILFDTNTHQLEKTNNFYTVLKAVKICEDRGLKITHVNLPSATSISGLDHLKDIKNSVGEPGHGLSGTTPLHLCHDHLERPCVVYLSEVSHHYQDNSVIYAGGVYRRGHFENARIQGEIVSVLPFEPTNIDYTLSVKGHYDISQSVIMAFRFQIFVTRSDVVLIEGLSKNQPYIQGIYTSLGEYIS